MKTFKQFLESKDRENFRGRHTKDQKHGKNGYVGGNPRYSDPKAPGYKKNEPRNSRNAAKNVEEE